MFRPGDVDVVPAVGLGEFESPDSLLKGGPIRERLLDIVTGLRIPTKVDAFSIHYSGQYQTGNSWE
jgi:hypothetical protein